jgi:hypothetical protein
MALAAATVPCPSIAPLATVFVQIADESRRRTWAMERDRDASFDAMGFLDLLDALRGDYRARTGVLRAQIHLRDGEPWAVFIQFADAESTRAA